MPSASGVYVFSAEKNNILYIGKSKNLRARVSSYFKSLKYLSDKTAIFLKKVTSLHLTITQNELEALLLEARYVRKLQPKYNRQLKDDKSPIYIAITNEKYPRINLIRKRDLKTQNPGSIKHLFGPFLSARETRLILNRARHLFPFCAQKSKVKRSCFYTHLGLCPGACVAKISPRDYQKIINNLIKLFNGNITSLEKSISCEMKQTSQNQNFELARQKRDLLKALQNLKNISSENEILSDNYPIHLNKLDSLFNLLKDNGLIFKKTAGFRIEGYDTSHLGGNLAVASMAVFIDGYPAKDQYRRFRIRSVWKPDDPKMLAEVLRRRLLHSQWKKPNLILIDGGQPQLLQIQKEFRVENTLPGNIPFIGLAKEYEKTVIPVKIGIFKEINIGQSHPGIQLLMAIRDEAHRFAQKYHHQLRNKIM